MYQREVGSYVSPMRYVQWEGWIISRVPNAGGEESINVSLESNVTSCLAHVTKPRH